MAKKMKYKMCSKGMVFCCAGISIAIIIGVIVIAMCSLNKRLELTTQEFHIDTGQVEKVACINSQLSDSRDVYITDKNEIARIVELLGSVTFEYERELQDRRFGKREVTGGYNQLLVFYGYDGRKIRAFTIDGKKNLLCLSKDGYRYIGYLQEESELRKIVTELVEEYWKQ